MPVPDYSDPTPARRQIADDLRAQIRAGRYAPNDRLPSNVALAELYGVAPETIRSALDELRAEKTVETRSTRGTFVTSVPGAGARPDLKAISEQLSDLQEQVKEYEDLRIRVGRLEAIVLNLAKRSGLPNPFGGEDDGTQKATRRGRAG